MTYDKLIQRRKMKAYEADEREIRSLLEIAARDLATAESMVDVNPDWAYNISYNAMLQTSRALMLRKGYRPRGSGQHATVVQFMKLTIDDEHRNSVTLFDQMRRKRNRMTYDVAGLVGKNECENALAVAHDFVALVTSLIDDEPG